MRTSNKIKSDRYYEAALICLSGHTINIFSESQPEQNTDCCPRCGKTAINCCSACGAPIRGCYHVRDENGWLGAWDRCSEQAYRTPPYCHHCGRPYPWTSTRLAVAAKLIAALPHLATTDKEELISLLEDLLRETPQTVLAALKLSAALQKASPLLSKALCEAILPYAAPSAQRLLAEPPE